MAHNRYYRHVVLPPQFVPTPAFVRHLDQVSSESVNGDEGGTYAPETPLVVGGAGVALATAGGFTGGVSTGAGAPAGALVLGDGDWPTHAARTRTVIFHVRGDFARAFDDVAQATIEHDESVPGRLTFSASATDNFAFRVALDNKKFPIGATIASVTVRWSVGVRPVAVPSLPEVYFYCDALTDNAALPAPGTVDAYFNGGRPQNLSVTPSNNTTVVANRNYRVTVVDPSMTSNVFHSIAIYFTNILSMKPGL